MSHLSGVDGDLGSSERFQEVLTVEKLTDVPYLT